MPYNFAEKNNFSDLTQKEQQFLIQKSLEASQHLKLFEDEGLAIKFLCAISATNGTVEILAHFLKLTDPKSLSDLLDPYFLLTQAAGILAGIPIFVLGDYLIVFTHNRYVNSFCQELEITEDLIDSAESKLDGLKVIPYDSFTLGLIKFLVCALSTFVVFSIALNMAMLIDNPFYSLGAIYLTNTLLIPVLSLCLNLLKLPVRTESLLGIYGAFTGLGTAAVVLKEFSMINIVVEKIAKTFLGPLLGSSFAAIPGGITNAVALSESVMQEEIRRIEQGEAPRTSMQKVGALLKQSLFSCHQKLCLAEMSQREERIGINREI